MNHTTKLITIGLSAVLFIVKAEGPGGGGRRRADQGGWRAAVPVLDYG